MNKKLQGKSFKIEVFMNEHDSLFVKCYDQYQCEFVFNLQSKTSEYIFDMMAAEMKELYK